MIKKPIQRIIAPSLLSPGEPLGSSELEVFGACVWLWTHSHTHHHASLLALPTQLLAPIEHQQFALFFDTDGRPVGYLAWAFFNADSERAYYQQGHAYLAKQPQAWRDGDRLWILDIIAPFGHVVEIRRFIKERLFSSQCFRYLYHQGHVRGKRIKFDQGRRVNREQAQHWQDEHPFLRSLP